MMGRLLDDGDLAGCNKPSCRKSQPPGQSGAGQRQSERCDDAPPPQAKCARPYRRGEPAGWDDDYAVIAIPLLLPSDEASALAQLCKRAATTIAFWMGASSKSRPPLSMASAPSSMFTTTATIGDAWRCWKLSHRQAQASSIRGSSRELAAALPRTSAVHGATANSWKPSPTRGTRVTRQAWKVAYPLCEVLFRVVCGTIANCDDYEDIVDWGKAHLRFLGALRSSTTTFRALMGCAQ
jgi:hypothetical protein